MVWVAYLFLSLTCFLIYPRNVGVPELLNLIIGYSSGALTNWGLFGILEFKPKSSTSLSFHLIVFPSQLLSGIKFCHDVGKINFIIFLTSSLGSLSLSLFWHLNLSLYSKKMFWQWQCYLYSGEILNEVVLTWNYVICLILKFYFVLDADGLCSVCLQQEREVPSDYGTYLIPLPQMKSKVMMSLYYLFIYFLRVQN